MDSGNISQASDMLPVFFDDSLPICQIEIDMDVVFVDSIRSTNMRWSIRIFKNSKEGDEEDGR